MKEKWNGDNYRKHQLKKSLNTKEVKEKRKLQSTGINNNNFNWIYEFINIKTNEKLTSKIKH